MVKINGKTLKQWKIVIFWRILKKSIIFRNWYKEFLIELIFELERIDFDISERDEIMAQYREKYNRFK